MLQKATKGLITLTLEPDYDQLAMDLPPVTSAVFLIAKLFRFNVGVPGISDMSLLLRRE
jgi:hypothetical protein